MEQKSKAGRWNWLSERPRQEVTGDMKLEARELSFRYDNGNRQILNKMSMTLESTDRLGLIAPSGFGKTTFCKILAGYEEPDSGEVLLEGKPLRPVMNYMREEASFSLEGVLSGADDMAASGTVGQSQVEDGRSFKRGGPGGKEDYRWPGN